MSGRPACSRWEPPLARRPGGRRAAVAGLVSAMLSERGWRQPGRDAARARLPDFPWLKNAPPVVQMSCAGASSKILSAGAIRGARMRGVTERNTDFADIGSTRFGLAVSSHDRASVAHGLRIREEAAGRGSQQEHHRKLSFEEELVQFLKKHAVEYDERYVAGG